MTLLFEYGNWEYINNRDTLEKLLISVWQNRQITQIEENYLQQEAKELQFQPFLNFDGNKIKAKNYIGFIQTENDIVEIYPKVFRNVNDLSINKGLILKHIFYWLNYCRKWRFPFHQITLDTEDINEFPELIINLIANQFLETVFNQPLSLYQPTEETLKCPKGAINFKRYIINGLSKGNHHYIDCDYEPFSYNNKVNRIIKYCSRLLISQTKFAENHRVLQDVLFVLDDVDDVPCNIYDAERVQINPFIEEYSMVLDSCKIILNQQLYSNQIYDLTQWCLLLPMEYVFEDFLAGFIEENFCDEWIVEYQKSNKYLAVNEEGKKVFNLQHDIFLTSRDSSDLKIIMDTKYKMRDSDFKDDLKKGIEQSDLYQMVSYAYKTGCTNILLVYPNLGENISSSDEFEITSGFPAFEEIIVTAIEIPFWSITNFQKINTNLKNIIERNLRKIKIYFHQL
jgi:5-methylcytosine-specific restriction enzyme subunit McrC